MRFIDFSKAFDRVNHGLFGHLDSKIPWSVDFLDGFLFDRSYTPLFRVGEYLSETIYCHSAVPQGSHLGHLFFIADINDMLGNLENVGVLAYAT
jgi:hypothetical protein